MTQADSKASDESKLADSNTYVPFLIFDEHGNVDEFLSFERLID